MALQQQQQQWSNSNRLQWVRTAAASMYLAQSVERIVRDVEGVSSYQGLMVQQDDYVLETTGVSVKLINLTGTIPIMFRQSVYNIPVKIWLPPMYPRDAPLAYVQPTSTMLVKQGKHVDPSGKVYLPYLHYWPNRSDQASLSELIKTMVDVFSVEPPVYARPQPHAHGQVQSPPPQQQHQPQQHQFSTNNSTNNANFFSSSSPSSTAAVQTHPPPVGAISPHEERQSLLSSVNDSLKRIAKNRQEDLLAELDHLLIEQQNLKENAQIIANGMAGLNSSLEQMRVEATSLAQANSSLNRQLDDLKGRSDINVDDAIKPATVLHAQLYALVAEEKAIEDTIYLLSKALDQRKLSLDQFTKLVRNLANEQFLKKAHIIKIAGILGYK